MKKSKKVLKMSEIMYSIGIVNKDGSAIQESAPESVVSGARARAFFDKVGYTASLHWLTPFNNVPYGDIKPVADDNGNVIVRVPRFNEGEWGRMIVLAESVADSLEAMFGLGFEDGQTVKTYESEVDGYSITIEKSVPAPKRLFLVFDDTDDAYDVDDDNGSLDMDKMRDAVSEVVSNFDSSDIEDIVYDMCDMGETVDIECGNDYRSYEKKDILDAMGDWEYFVDSQRDSVAEVVVDDILEEWQCNGAEGSASNYVCAHFEMREAKEDDN